MPSERPVETIPLREDASGALRVGDTWVLHELVIDAFEDGATPETIARRFDTLVLSDIYAVVTDNLRHRDEIADYLGAGASTPPKSGARSNRPGVTSARSAAGWPQLGIRSNGEAMRLAFDENFSGEIVRGLFRRCRRVTDVQNGCKRPDGFPATSVDSTRPTGTDHGRAPR